MVFVPDTSERAEHVRDPKRPIPSECARPAAMRFERGTRITSTVGIAIVSSAITTMLLTGGYAVASTVLVPDSVTSAHIVNGTIRGADLSPRLSGRIDRPRVSGPQGPQGPPGPPGPPGASAGLHEVQIPLLLGRELLTCTQGGSDWQLMGDCPFPSDRVGGYAVLLDSSDYPATATLRAEYAFSYGSAEGACMRLFDLTDEAAMVESEACGSWPPGSWPPESSVVRVSSAPLPLPSGEHLIDAQFKYLDPYNANSGTVTAFAIRLIIEWR